MSLTRRGCQRRRERDAHAGAPARSPDRRWSGGRRPGRAAR